ncbi:glycosyltransferase family 2 protein [Neobacillus drentensis]|uniref:glycosyltransferase family 2 protein n=1 Tax=Neobacillus drentensis TaxID=220684 RepID=UPI0028633A6C|nr:glycosyltransferase [Neobacillus drentensis]MDR7240807.1 glycosyltransferase involved in cell wall biosynthesis [Neobacillus drentensis]
MKLSVVTAVYNGGEFIRDSIESILNQTHANFEYIIVNDGSTDETKDILAQITDTRVKVIHQVKNQGAAKCLQLAIARANGSLIAIQDADDISFPHRLEKQASFLINNPEFGLIGSYIQCICQQKDLQRRALFTERLINSVHPQDYYGSRFCHGTFMFSKMVYEQIGGYSSKYKIAYDFDLLQRFRLAAKIHKIPEKLYGYRIHNASLSNQDIEETNAESLEISIKGIVEFTKNLKSHQKFLIIGTDAACYRFKQKIEPQLQGDFHYAAPIVNESIRNYHVIVLDYYGSKKFTQELSQKGVHFFKVWCSLH